MKLRTALDFAPIVGSTMLQSPHYLPPQRGFSGHHFPKSLIIGTFFALFAALFAACDSESNAKANQISEGNQGKGANQSANGRAKLYDFDMVDTTLSTGMGSKTRVCVAVQSEETTPNYNIRITKPPLNGSLTPLLSGSELCFDYTPNADFTGKDPFEFSICNTSGYCLDKTWFVAVKGKAVSTPKEKTGTNPIDIKTDVPVAPANNSSIFDPAKKNRDNYNPNN
jgi:hypothetical protein